MILFTISETAPMTPILRSCKICDSLTWRPGLELELESLSLFEDESTKVGSDWSDKSLVYWKGLDVILLCASWMFLDMVSLCSDHYLAGGKFLKAFRSLKHVSGLSAMTSM